MSKTPLSPLSNHPNKNWHNWLVYKSGDVMLRRYSNVLKGDVVDLGCGTGYFKDWIKSLDCTYFGIDWAESVHDINVDLSADLNCPISVDSEKFDSAFCISVLEHLHSPLVFLSEVNRILKPGGVLLLQVPWQWQLHEIPHDYFRYTPYALKRMMQETGFTKCEVYAQSGIFSTLALKVSYFLRRSAPKPKLLRYSFYSVTYPLIQILFFLAPLFDKLDRDWFAEAQGYYVIAHK